MQRTAMTVYPWAWIYFASFVIVAVFVVINLFIAVVINNLQTVKEEQRIVPGDAAAPLRRQLAELRGRLDAFEAALDDDRRG